MISSNQRIPNDLLRLITLFAVIKVGLHLYTNLFAGYGIFRDELYYLACAAHPDYGYVDQPPLCIWILSAYTTLFGDSVFAIRLLPALFSGLAIFIAGLTTYELGGRKLAVSIVCTALIVSIIHLAYSTYYSMNAIDLLLWSLALFMTVRLLNTGRHTYWLWLGLVLGLALLNKIGALFLGTGLAAALVITARRRWLATRWPYLAALISLALFLPYVVWNLEHDMAHLEFIHNASTIKYAGMSPAAFWMGQLILNNPVAVPVAVCGIVYAFSAREDHRYRFLFIIFLVVALIFTVNGTSKPEYLAPVFPVLLMGGALKIEQWALARKWVGYAFVVLLVSGGALIPFALPVLPVETYIRYSERLGQKPESAEGKELAALPQFYADMFGWEEKAAALAEAWHALSPEEQRVCVIFNDNYGRAGAVDYFARKYNMPHGIGNHNNYWIWGPGEGTAEIVLTLDDEVGDKMEFFESVEDLGTITCTYCMPYENNLHVYLCRGLKIPIGEAWPDLKAFI